MRSINSTNPPKPCDYFDLIGGTSTGGLIAIMLGRLQMDVQSCIKAYLKISSEVFQPLRAKNNIFGRGKDAVKVRGRFSSKALEDHIKAIVMSMGEEKEAKLKDDANPNCRV